MSFKEKVYGRRTKTDHHRISINTLVNVYVDLVIFTRIAVPLRLEVVDIGFNTM